MSEDTTAEWRNGYYWGCKEMLETIEKKISKIIQEEMRRKIK